MSYELTDSEETNEKAAKCEKCGRTHGDCPGCKEFCLRSQQHVDSFPKGYSSTKIRQRLAKLTGPGEGV